MKPRLCDPHLSHEYFEKKMSFTLGPVELKRWIDDKEAVVIVDVRRPEDYDKGHIPGAINLPKETWASPQGLSKDKVNVLYCYTQECHLAPAAAVEFSAQGHCCMELEGGFDAWKRYDLPVEGGRKHPAGTAKS